MSAYGYDSGPDRYSDAEWEHSRQETLAARAADPSPQGADVGRSPSTLAPGIVAMSLRGDEQDVERFVTALRKMGIVAWKANSRGTQSGNRAGYRYFSVKVPRDG